MYCNRLFCGLVTRASRPGNIEFGNCSDTRIEGDSAAWRWLVINRPLAAGYACSVIVRQARKVQSRTIDPRRN